MHVWAAKLTLFPEKTVAFGEKKKKRTSKTEELHYGISESSNFSISLRTSACLQVLLATKMVTA